MKTKCLYRHAVNCVTFMLVFFWSAMSANAQCPTIANSNPPPICDASGLTINDLNAYATSGSNGLVWYNVSTGGTALNGTQLLSQGTYYADDNSGSCGTRASVVIDFQVNPISQSLDGIYCSNENPTIQSYIDEVLQPNIPPGGSVEIYTDFSLSNQPNNTDPLPDGATNYYIVFVDSSGCEGQIIVGSTAVFDAPNDPMPTTNQQFCSLNSPTVGDLDAGTTENVSWYDTVDGSGNPIPPALSNTTALINGNTYYVQVDAIFCVSNTASVTVTIDSPNEPGISAELEYCDDSLPTNAINLFDELTGMPDSNGTWSGPLTTTNGHQGTVDISSLTEGNYMFTYTVPSNGECPENSSTVTITVFEALSSGIASGLNPASFCESGLPSAFDLFTLLDNEDPNGQWSQGTSSTDPTVTSPIDLTLFTAGTYNFTYTQNITNPCPEDSTTVQIIILEDPNAGTAINALFCENDLTNNSPYDLFNALDGTQDNNSGIWTDSNGNTVSNSINITGFTVADSPYQFTYTLSNGTCEDMETITITIEDAPESGEALTPIEICEDALTDNSPFDLFTLLDGTQDTNGTWLDVNGTVPNPIDITVLTAGTYDYTYSVADIGTCSDVDVVVQIIVLPLPETGIPTPAVFCENDLTANSPLDLFGQLAGEDAGGTWSDDDTSGALTGSDVDLTALTIGVYNYSYTITDANGCTNTSTVTITIEDAPESGEALTPIEICEDALTDNSPFDLFTLLDGTQDTNGTWSDINGTVSNPIDITGLTAGTYDYTYSVADIGTCSDVDVVVQIIVLPLPETGVPTPALFCENDLAANSPLDLFGQLAGEDAGGTWSDDDASGALTGSDVDLTALTIGVYNYSYTITDANGCTNTSTVTITIEDAPESGEALTPIEICEDALTDNSPFDLFTLLDGTQDANGTWSDINGTVPNPIDITGLTAGTYDYTYSVADIGTCSDVDVVVQIIVLPLPETGVPTPALFCENDLAANSPLDLFGQLAGEDAGGTWSDDDASGALTGSDVDLTTLTIGVYNYSYTITDVNGCTNTSTVTITIEDAPESGTANAPIEFCLAEITTGQTFDLYDLLEGEDQTGTWSDDTPSSQLSGSILTLDGLASGTYNFTYDVTAIGTCDDNLVSVSVIINDTLAPTVVTPQVFCDEATVADLFGTGTNIQWYDQVTNGVVLEATTPLVDGVTYYATQTDASTGCESSTRAAVTVTINQSPNSGNPNATGISVCNDNTSIDLNTGLDGTQDSGGVWQDTDGTGGLSGNIFDATGIAAGTYNFTYVVTGTAPCTDSSTTIQVVLSAPLNPGTDATLDVCSTNGTTDLFTLIGTADVGGTWSPALNSGTGVFDPLVDADGTYTYVLTNACGNYTSEVVVTVTPAPNAGTDGTFTICAIDVDATNSQLDLLTILNDTPDTTGTFTNNDNANGFSGTLLDLTQVTAGNYTFTYTVNANSPCTVNATAVATVVINDSDAPTVIDANPSFCLVDSPTVSNLDAFVNGTTINWYDDAALTILLDASEALIDGEDYYATQTGTSACESSANVMINVSVNDEQTPTLIDSNLELCINDAPTINELTLNISEYNSNTNNVVWYTTETGGTPLSNSDDLSINTTYYAALVNATTGCESSVRLEVSPDLTGCGILAIPDGFSPNGDGTNDTFDIDNLDVLYPDFQIEIYNRNGNIVYRGNASTPRFDGTSNESSIGKGDLPVGVYFYIFNFNDGVNKPKQGRLYLSR